MKVLIVGANGQIGRHIIRMLGESNQHAVRAMIRNEAQAADLEKLGAETVITDLEGSVGSIAEAMKGCDAVVFTAGSGSHTGPDKTILVDLDGAVKTIEAAEQAGVERFIMISAIQSHNRENWGDKIRHYMAAKHYADRFLEASKLNYTIIRPGGLLNEPGTGHVSIEENLERSTIPREDVARVVIASLEESNTYRRGFDLVSGSTPIEQALKMF